MFKKPVILTKVLQETQDVTLCSREIQVEYEGFTYIIKIEPTTKQTISGQNTFVWVVYLKSHVNKNKDIIKMIAYSTKLYDYDPEKMEKDAFKCIQDIACLL